MWFTEFQGARIGRFLTPAGKGLTVVLIVGFGLGALYWGLVLWRGAPERVAVTTAPEP